MNATMLAPTCLTLGADDAGHRLPLGWMLIRLDPGLRRSLLSSIHREPSSDALVDLVTSAESVIVANLLEPWILAGRRVVSAAMSRVIFDEAWSRIARCLFLVSNYAPPAGRLCWFVAAGTTAAIDRDSIEPTDRAWFPESEMFMISSNTAGTWTERFRGMERLWLSIQKLLGFDELAAIYRSETSRKQWLDAGNEHVHRMVEEAVRAKVSGEPIVPVDITDDNTFQIATGQQTRWFFEGYFNGYRSEIAKVSDRIRVQSASPRFSAASNCFSSHSTCPLRFASPRSSHRWRRC